MSLIARLPRTVLVLGAVSFFTDVSSEMIYPLLPNFLAVTLGASALALGLIEGLAETTAAVLKVVSGIWTDRSGKRRPLLLFGYALSSLSRPLMGLAAIWPVVLLLRLSDRVGKGLRSSPRDALIADVTPPERRGAAYGLHRAMDHAGSVVGPLVAAALMHWAHLSESAVFLWAAVPGLAAMALLVPGTSEPARPLAKVAKSYPPLRWSSLPPRLRGLLMALALFALGNSTDAFLLLKLRQCGVPMAWTAALWALFHVVKMVATWTGGQLSDRLGRSRMVLTGWVVYALVYLGLAFVDSPAPAIALFLSYGLYFGLTEPVMSAWVADLVPAERRGAAFGAWHAVTALSALPASLLFGAAWTQLGSKTAFCFGATCAALAALLLAGVTRKGPIETSAA